MKLLEIKITWIAAKRIKTALSLAPWVILGISAIFFANMFI